jgi:hypothetical protein
MGGGGLSGGREGGASRVVGRRTRTAWGTAWVRPPMAAPAGSSWEPLGASSPRPVGTTARRLADLGLVPGVLVLTCGDDRVSLGLGSCHDGAGVGGSTGSARWRRQQRSPPQRPHQSAEKSELLRKGLITPRKAVIHSSRRIPLHVSDSTH